VADPTATPFAKPALTVNTLVLLLAHVELPVMSYCVPESYVPVAVSCCVPPTTTPKSSSVIKYWVYPSHVWQLLLHVALRTLNVPDSIATKMCSFSVWLPAIFAVPW